MVDNALDCGFKNSKKETVTLGLTNELSKSNPADIYEQFLRLNEP